MRNHFEFAASPQLFSKQEHIHCIQSLLRFKALQHALIVGFLPVLQERYQIFRSLSQLS